MVMRALYSHERVLEYNTLNEDIKILAKLRERPVQT
jgi:hypothetical protein